MKKMQYLPLVKAISPTLTLAIAAAVGVLMGCGSGESASSSAALGALDRPAVVLRTGPFSSSRIGGMGVWVDVDVDAPDYLSATNPQGLEIEWEGRRLAPQILATRPLEAPRWDVLIWISTEGASSRELRDREAAQACARRLLERNLDVQFVLASRTPRADFHSDLEDLLFTTSPSSLRMRDPERVEVSRLAWRRDSRKLVVLGDDSGEPPASAPSGALRMDLVACARDQFPAEVTRANARRFLLTLAFSAPDVEEGLPTRRGTLYYRGEEIPIAVRRETRLQTRVLQEAEDASAAIFRASLGLRRSAQDYLLHASPVAGPARARLIFWKAGAPETLAETEVTAAGRLTPPVSVRQGPLVFEVRRPGEMGHYYLVSRQNGDTRLTELTDLADVENRLAPADAYRLLRQGVSAFAGPQSPLRNLTLNRR